MKQDAGGMRRSRSFSQSVDAAIRCLGPPARRQILGTLPKSSWGREGVRRLVGDDIELYHALLEDSSLKECHLVPIGESSEDAWPEMAEAAFAAGYSADEIVGATYASPGTWSGEESGMWKMW